MFNKLNASYSLRLLTSYFIINSFIIIVMGVVSYHIISSALYENVEYSTVDILNQIANNADNKLSEIENLGKSFLFDSKFHEYCSVDNTQIHPDFVLNEYLIPKGNSSLYLTNSKISANLYLNNTKIPEYYDRENIDIPNDILINTNHPVFQSDFKVLHTTRIDRRNYYEKLIESNDVIVWTQLENDKPSSEISLFVNLIDPSTMQNNGVLRILLPLDELFIHITTRKPFNNPMISLQNLNGNVLYKNFDDDILESSDYLTYSKHLDRCNINIVMYTPKSAVRQNAMMMLLLVLTICFSVFCVASLFVLIIRKGLLHNLNNIMIGIKEFQKGNLDYEITAAGDDEFGQIGVLLNSFTSNINHLINDFYEVMIQKQDIEMQALQARVNPHFLYNILSIIGRQAKAGYTDRIESIVVKTARFYRMTLSKNCTDSFVGNEIEIVKSYSDILNIIYKDSIKVNYDLDENSLCCKIPHFIIQPFIENCVKHAMIDTHLNILVKTAISDGILTISVKDDGVGISEEKLKTLFAYKKAGYGIYNLNARILLRYKDPKYAIEIKSKENQGTEVIITLPCEYNITGDEADV